MLRHSVPLMSFQEKTSAPGSCALSRTEMPHTARPAGIGAEAGGSPCYPQGFFRSWFGQGSAGAQGSILLLGNTLQQLPWARRVICGGKGMGEKAKTSKPDLCLLGGPEPHLDGMALVFASRFAQLRLLAIEDLWKKGDVEKPAKRH